MPAQDAKCATLCPGGGHGAQPGDPLTATLDESTVLADSGAPPDVELTHGISDAGGRSRSGLATYQARSVFLGCFFA